MTKKIPQDKIAHLGCDSSSDNDSIAGDSSSETESGSDSRSKNSFTAESLESISKEDVSYSFLEGEFGIKISDENYELVENEYNGAKILHLLYGKGIGKNRKFWAGNPFVRILLNMTLQRYGNWIPRPVDFENARMKGELKSSVDYGVSALVLMDDPSKYEYFAKDLSNQLREKEYQVDDGPIVLPLAGLSLDYNPDSPLKVDIKLTDSSEIICAPEMIMHDITAGFNKCDKNGLPITKNFGPRKFSYRTNKGLYLFTHFGDTSLSFWDHNLSKKYNNNKILICSKKTS